MKDAFPMEITEGGVTAKIRRVIKVKDGVQYPSYVVDYMLLGRRKLVWRSDLDDAKQAARDACKKIANGYQMVLELRNGDRMEHMRAKEHLAPFGIALDVAARDHAEVLALLAGRATPAEAARDWLKRHDVRLPKITVPKAKDELIAHATADGKSDLRIKQLSAVLDAFAEDFSADVDSVTPALISAWLSGLPHSERTRRNYRDVLGYFNRWLILRGYLAKGTDWLEGVQKYTARKLGEITTYTPEEIRMLLTGCDKRLLPFIAIGAFAGLRHAEIARLDWSEVELADKPEKVGDVECFGFIEVKAGKSKVEARRLVPVHANLKAWLQPLRKGRGQVCEFANITKQLLARAKSAGVEWKHNALRHSFVSYRVAECADVARTADEAGNSPAVIRANYLRRVKPVVAAEWFNIMPPKKRKDVTK